MAYDGAQNLTFSGERAEAERGLNKAGAGILSNR